MKGKLFGALIAVLILTILFSGCLENNENNNTKSEAQAKFRLINNNGEPLSNASVTICDDCLKLDPEICCPYCNESYREIYGRYYTDEYGILYLDIKNIDVQPPCSIVLEVNNGTVHVERSDTLGHTFSSNHLRVLNGNESGLISNKIYNLDTKQVKEIFIADGSEITYTFDTIDLVI
jgi:hypothetical protein